MKKALVFFFIMALFGIFGAPIGAALLLLLDTVAYWVGGFSIVPSGVAVLLTVSLNERVNQEITMFDILAFVLTISYFLVLIPSLLVGFYVARSATLKRPFYVSGVYSIGVVATFLNTVLAWPLIIHACLAATFSFFVLHHIAKFFLSRTEFALIDPPPEESLNTP